MTDCLLFEQRGAVGVVTLNRPERLNAIDHDLLRSLRGFFDDRHRDYGTRVIVITGMGRAFCAGLDLKAAGEQGPWQPGVGRVQDSYTFQEDIADLMIKMRRCPQPIIAAVNGAATGGGLSIAIASDMRVGTEMARFACSYLNLGLGGADVGSSYFLPKLIGAAHSADMLYSGRIVESAEAKEMGLLNQIVPREELLPRAIAIAEGDDPQGQPARPAADQRGAERDGHRHLAGERTEAGEPQPDPRQPDRRRRRSAHRLVRKARPGLARRVKNQERATPLDSRARRGLPKRRGTAQ